eukprot:4989827-Amphidinium_carterae.1
MPRWGRMERDDLFLHPPYCDAQYLSCATFSPDNNIAATTTDTFDSNSNQCSARLACVLRLCN